MKYRLISAGRVLVALGFTPILALSYPFEPHFRHEVFDWAFFWWARAWLFAAGIRVRVELDGTTEVPCSGVVFSNHQSELDIPAIVVALRGRVRFVTKIEMAKKDRFFRVIARLYEFPLVDRENTRRSMPTLRALVERLKNWQNHPTVCVFPEGTFSRDGKLLPYNRLFFGLAKRAETQVTPCAVTGADELLEAYSRSYRAGEITIHLGEPLRPEDVAKTTSDQLLNFARAFAVRQILPF